MSVKDCLPQTSGRNKKSIPGWNDEPFREEAMFSHSLWISAGNPINNTLHNIMKKTRNVYHYQIRKKCCRRDKLLNAYINGEGDIFHELKKLRMVSRTVSKPMDGDKKDVSEHFANVYERIYNSVDNKEEMSIMYSRVNKSIYTTSLSDVDLFTNDIVREATMNLKSIRNDLIFDF